MNRQTFIFATLVALALISASKIQAEPHLDDVHAKPYDAKPSELRQLKKAKDINLEKAALAPAKLDSKPAAIRRDKVSTIETACAEHTADQHDPSLIRRHDVGIVISRLGGYADAYSNE